MFGIQEHLIREASGLKERSLGEEMDPVRSWVRNVGVVDANVAAQRYSANPTCSPLTSTFSTSFTQKSLVNAHGLFLKVTRNVSGEGEIKNYLLQKMIKFILLCFICVL